MKRRSFLQAAGSASVALLGAGTVAGCGGGDSSSGSKTLRVTLANHVWTDVIKKSLPDFEEQSGLKVDITQLGEDQLSDQYNVKLNAGTDEIDAMMFRPLQEGKLFGQNGYMVDLVEWTGKNADWAWDDFQDGPVEVSKYEDTQVGIPIITEQEVLYYRKDLLEKAGLEVPKTLEDLQAAAQKIKQDNPGTAGFVARTERSAAVTQFSSFLYSMGGDFIVDGKSAVGTDVAKQAYELYGSLIRESGPDKVSTDMSWEEAMAIFTQGKAAFYTEADSLYQNATDEAKSNVSDKVGFALFPEGDAGSKPYNVASWALGINEGSENQENAWAFIEWATSKDMTLTVQKEGVPAARASVWADKSSTSSYPEDLAPVMEESGKIGIGHDRPLVIDVAKAREIVGDPIVVAIAGEDVTAAADKANEAFQALLDDEAN